MTTTKYCSRCDTTKEVAEFSSDRSTKDGLCARCRKCRSDYGKRWYAGLGPDRKRKRNEGREEEKAAWQKAYFARHRVRMREIGRQWRERNRDKVRAITRAAMRRRRATLKGKLENNVSRALHRALNGRKNRQPSFALLGFTVEDLIKHLERQFQSGMTWENYGDWHVDHIRPLASFTYSTATDPEFGIAWALTNLRPLWAKENISKGARVSLLI